MAVFTQVTTLEAQSLLDQLQLGEVLELKGIEGGIENTNYFLDCKRPQSTEDEAPAHYVLTLFERLSKEELPFYLHLMKHLANKGIPVPDPQTNPQGELLFDVAGKPAALVNKLNGKSHLQPTSSHCATVGQMLAKMHLAGKDFELQQPNLRGLQWWLETTPSILDFLEPHNKALLQQEIAFQLNLSQTSAYQSLPRGPVHADLFRDNVMFDGEQLTGFFDFYFAGTDTWLFDISVCLNDWCIDLTTGALIVERMSAFLDAYQQERPLSQQERALFNPMLRAAALRFWISRLWDFYLPREANLLKAHDPKHFENILNLRVHNPVHYFQS
jgi:homoserine kinase type II